MNGEYHRLDGPAVITSDGITAFLINDHLYRNEEEWKEEIKRREKQ